MIVSEKNLPHLYKAFCMVAENDGVPVAYSYDIPDTKRESLIKANAGLAILTDDELKAFATGHNFDEIQEITKRTINLTQADKVLDEFCNYLDDAVEDGIKDET